MAQKNKKSKCDCYLYERQVCDTCQGVTGKEKDRQPRSKLSPEARTTGKIAVNLAIETLEHLHQQINEELGIRTV